MSEFDDWLAEVDRRLRMMAGRERADMPGTLHDWEMAYHRGQSPLDAAMRAVREFGLVRPDVIGAPKVEAQGYAKPHDVESLNCTIDRHAMAVTAEPAEGIVVVQILRCRHIGNQERMANMIAMHQALTGAIMELRSEIAAEN